MASPLAKKLAAEKGLDLSVSLNLFHYVQRISQDVAMLY